MLLSERMLQGGRKHMFEEEVTIGLVYNWNYRNNTLKTCGGFHRARNRNVMEL